MRAESTKLMPAADVFLAQLHAARQQAVMFGEALHRVEHAGFQSGFMRAALRGVDQVDETLRCQRALRPGEHPGRALALGETAAGIGIAVGIAFAAESRNQGFNIAQQFGQVLRQAIRIGPDFFLIRLTLALDGEFYRDAGQQHRLGTQQAFHFVQRDARRIKEFRIRPGADQGPGLFFQALAGHRQRHREHAAIGEFERGNLAVALHGDGKAGGQRIGHRNADAVQAAGEGISALAGGLVELAAGMQAGEHDNDRRLLLGRMRADRNAAPVVLHRHRTIEMDAHRQRFGVTGQRFIGGVVDHLLDEVRRRVGAGVHARPRAHRLQAF
jgi:hypothetical protein